VQSIEQQRKEALEEIYLILAEFFKIPTKGFYEEVANGAIDARLRDLFAAVEYHYPGISLASGFTGFEDMRQNYINCFIGSAKPFAPPIESIYKVWTTDPSAEWRWQRKKAIYMEILHCTLDTSLNISCWKFLKNTLKCRII